MTALSIRNNNPGNLRPRGSATGFRSFGTPEEGLAAMREDLIAKITGQSPAMRGLYGEGYQPTLQNVISTWAPSSENDTQAYLDFVSGKTGLKPDSVLGEQDLDRLIPAMIEQEGGQEAVNHFKVASKEQDSVDVRLPNGVVIRNVPVGTTRAELLERLKKKGYDTSAFEAQEKPEAQEAETIEEDVAESQDPGFLERFGADLDERGKKYSEIAEAYDAGEQTLPETALQMLLTVGAGSVNDLVGEGLTSAGQGLSYLMPDSIEEPAKATAMSALKTIGDTLPAGNGSTLSEQLPKDLENISKWYGAFAKSNPRVHRNLEAAGNLAMVLPAAKTAQVAKSATKEAGRKLSGVLPSIDVKNAAKRYYKASEKAGGLVKEDEAFSMFERMHDKVVPKDPKDYEALKNEGYMKTYKDLERAYLGEDLSLENMVNIDRRLTADAQKFRGSDPNSERLVNDMKAIVREFMDNVTEQQMRDPKGFALYKEGVNLYAKTKRMETLEAILRRSADKEQPSTAIKNALIALRENPKKYAGFTVDEKKLIDRAIKTGAIEGLMRTLGSRLPTVGVLSAGPFLGPAALPMAAAAYGGSALARMGANTMRSRKVKKVIKKIQPKKSELRKSMKLKP